MGDSGFQFREGKDTDLFSEKARPALELSQPHIHPFVLLSCHYFQCRGNLPLAVSKRPCDLNPDIVSLGPVMLQVPIGATATLICKSYIINDRHVFELDMD